MEEKIFVLHEYGARSHYIGLEEYCINNGISLIYHEFNLIQQFGKALIKINPDMFRTAWANFIFLSKLFLSSRKTIILGIAPYDFRMIFFSSLATRHIFYYHTSWPFWTGDKVVKKLNYKPLKSIIMKSWHLFFEKRVHGIFTVTDAAKKSLLLNYKIKASIVTVHHSVDTLTYYPEHKLESPVKVLRFLFVGRLESYKGLEALCSLIDAGFFNTTILSFAGWGTYEQRIRDYAYTNKNIKFLGKLSSKSLASAYRDHDVLISPASKNEKIAFEELFGITIIEAMMCGAFAISSNHIGPKEIIDNGVNGFIVDDSNLVVNLKDIVKKLITMPEEKIFELKKNAITSSQRYSKQHVQTLWASILTNKFHE